MEKNASDDDNDDNDGSGEDEKLYASASLFLQVDNNQDTVTEADFSIALELLIRPPTPDNYATFLEEAPSINISPVSVVTNE